MLLRQMQFQFETKQDSFRYRSSSVASTPSDTIMEYQHSSTNANSLTILTPI